jgi:hypothetical protein
MIVLPAYPRPDGVVVRGAPEKVFPLHGRCEGGHVRLEGPVQMSAMGGSMSLEPLRVFGRLGPAGLEDGQLHAQAPLYKIKGNGTLYRGLSWTAVDDLSDPYLRLQAVGTARGERLPAGTPPATVEEATWRGPRALEVRLRFRAALAGDHLLTGLLLDGAAARIAAHASARVEPAAAGDAVTLTLSGIPRPAAGASLRLLLDGEPLSAPDAAP